MNTDHPFNLEELLARCVGRMDFAERLLDKFLVHFAEDIDRLEQHLEQGDWEELARVAHCMKGASANIAAAGLRDQVAGIEASARDHQAEGLPSQMRRLREEWSQFSNSVTHLRLSSKHCSAN